MCRVVYIFALAVIDGRMAHDLAHGVVCLELARIEKRAVRIEFGLDETQNTFASQIPGNLAAMFPGSDYRCFFSSSCRWIVRGGGSTHCF